MKCSVKHCGVQHKASLAIMDDGSRLLVLCTHHQILFAQNKLLEHEVEARPSLYEVHECEICSSPAMFYADEVELQLCDRHLKKLLKRSLNTIEYKILNDKHGEFELIHSNYYSKGGYALQRII